MFTYNFHQLWLFHQGECMWTLCTAILDIVLPSWATSASICSNISNSSFRFRVQAPSYHFVHFFPLEEIQLKLLYQTKKLTLICLLPRIRCHGAPYSCKKVLSSECFFALKVNSVCVDLPMSSLISPDGLFDLVVQFCFIYHICCVHCIVTA